MAVLIFLGKALVIFLAAFFGAMLGSSAAFIAQQRAAVNIAKAHGVPYVVGADAD